MRGDINVDLENRPQYIFHQNESNSLSLISQIYKPHVLIFLFNDESEFISPPVTSCLVPRLIDSNIYLKSLLRFLIITSVLQYPQGSMLSSMLIPKTYFLLSHISSSNVIIMKLFQVKIWKPTRIHYYFKLYLNLKEEKWLPICLFNTFPPHHHSFLPTATRSIF